MKLYNSRQSFNISLTTYMMDTSDGLELPAWVNVENSQEKIFQRCISEATASVSKMKPEIGDCVIREEKNEPKKIIPRVKFDEIEAVGKAYHTRITLFKTKLGYVQRPAYYQRLDDHNKANIRHGFYKMTGSDDEEDAREIDILSKAFDIARGNITVTQMREAKVVYDKEDAENKKKEKEVSVKTETEATLKRMRDVKAVSYHPMEAMNFMRGIPSPEKKKRKRTPHLGKWDYDSQAKPSALDYYLTFDDLTEEYQMKLENLDECTALIDRALGITSVWRLYSFHFKEAQVDHEYPKLYVTFENPSSRMVGGAAEPVADITKMETRSWTRRVREFKLGREWIYFLNMSADIVDGELPGGDALRKFFESASRIQNDKWTPNYQSLTVMTEKVNPERDATGFAYRIHCLVGRAPIGRDVDSRAYLVARPRHFDRNIMTDNTNLDREGLTAWMLKFAGEKNGRVYCGSTDFNVTTILNEMYEMITRGDDN